MTPKEADEARDWRGMDGATAWHLIDRHANSWEDVGAMMDAWLRANTTPCPAAPENSTGHKCGAEWK